MQRIIWIAALVAALAWGHVPASARDAAGGAARPFVASSVAWSPDGALIALGGNFGIVMYDGYLQPAKVQLQTNEVILGLAWSADSALLASIDSAQTISLWRPATGERAARLAGHAAEITALAWHPSNRTLASASQDGTLRIWDGKTMAASATYAAPAGPIQALAWSPAGDRLAAADESNLYVWPAGDLGGQPARLALRQSSAGSLQWLPDGQHLLTAGPRLWDLANQREEPPIASCSGATDQLARVSRDGLRIASAGMDQAGVAACVITLDAARQPESVASLRIYDGFRAFSGFDWSPDGHRLVSVSQRGWAYLWQADPQFGIAAGAPLAVAPRPWLRLAELEGVVDDCVPNDALRVILFALLEERDYQGFVNQLQALRPGLVEPTCLTHLTAVGTGMQVAPPLEEILGPAPRPLLVEPICSPNPSQVRRWRIRNPNAFPAKVEWRWSDQAAGSLSFVVSAAEGDPGAWVLATAPGGPGATFEVRSGDFLLSASGVALPCRVLYRTIAAR